MKTREQVGLELVHQRTLRRIAQARQDQPEIEEADPVSWGVEAFEALERGDVAELRSHLDVLVQVAVNEQPGMRHFDSTYPFSDPMMADNIVALITSVTLFQMRGPNASMTST